jgi:hypothetical protein
MSGRLPQRAEQRLERALDELQEALDALAPPYPGADLRREALRSATGAAARWHSWDHRWEGVDALASLDAHDVPDERQRRALKQLHFELVFLARALAWSVATAEREGRVGVEQALRLDRAYAQLGLALAEWKSQAMRRRPASERDLEAAAPAP